MMVRGNAGRMGGIIALAAGIAVGTVAMGEERQLLCATFPIELITRNVVAGLPGVKVSRLLPASLGCPHHYALTPQDMRKLATADILVINGLGMEDFLGAALKRAGPNLVVIDSSAGIANLLVDKGLPGGETCRTPGCSDAHHGAPNPHLFASPRQAARLARNIGEGLARADPARAADYRANADAYAARLERLADDLQAGVKLLRNTRIVQPHGVFDYLARDIGLEIVASLQPHGRELSAAEMLAVVRKIREQQAGAVFTEPQYSSRAGRTVAREAGVKLATLDPVATGPSDAPLDYYEQVMRKNLETLRRTLNGP